MATLQIMIFVVDVNSSSYVLNLSLIWQIEIVWGLCC